MRLSQKVKGVLMRNLQHIIFRWRQRCWQIFKSALVSFNIKLPLFWHFPWHLQKIKHFTLFLLHLKLLHVVQQQQIFDIILTVMIFSRGCHFGTNLQFSIFHPHHNGSCDAMLSYLLSKTNHFVNKLAWCVHLNIFSKRVLIANLSLE